METGAVNPKGARFTDQQLRDDLASGLRAADIARKYGVSPAAVSKRINRQELTTASAVMAPTESRRFVRTQINAMDELGRSLQRANLLQDACDEWLRDSEDPTKYDLGARYDEIEVTYTVEITTSSGCRYEKRKKKLTELMACLEGFDDDGARFCGWRHGEHKRADPRELILKTCQEVRQTVGTCADLAKTLADVRTMEAFREAVLEEIGKESPDCARRIVESVRRKIILFNLLGEPPTLHGGGAGNSA